MIEAALIKKVRRMLCNCESIIHNLHFAMMIRTVCVLVLAIAALGKIFENRISADEKLIFSSAVPQSFEKVVGDQRIVNGIDAPQGKYPSMVALYRDVLSRYCTRIGKKTQIFWLQVVCTYFVRYHTFLPQQN